MLCLFEVLISTFLITNKAVSVYEFICPLFFQCLFKAIAHFPLGYLSKSIDL